MEKQDIFRLIFGIVFFGGGSLFFYWLTKPGFDDLKESDKTLSDISKILDDWDNDLKSRRFK